MEILLMKYSYRILFPLAVVEGPILTLITGFLVWTGYFDLRIVVTILVCADILTDLWYYGIGRRVIVSARAQKYMSASKFLKTHLTMMRHFWSNHIAKTMFLGKQAYGLSVPIIISAGICKVPLYRFLVYSAPCSLVQAALLLGIGYYLGTSYYLVKEYLAYPGVIIAGLLIIVVLVYRYLTKRIAKTFDT